MAGRFVKFEKTLNGTEIQALTEVLAKHLAGMECLDYDNISRLKLNLKYELGQGVVRLKVDYQDTLSTEGGGGPEDKVEGSAVLQDHASFDYSEVKKRMKRDFRAIKVALTAGALPDAVVVDRFLVDSALIVRSPGDGDEYYGTYNEAIVSFTKAWKASDLVELRAAHQAITNCVKICHRMYK